MANGDTITYSYDVLGNRIEKQETKPDGTIVSTVNYSYNKENELTQVGNVTYQYDASGNETWNGNETFKWDAAGRLIEVDNASGQAIALYKYDSLNRLVQEQANGSTTNFLYDGTSNHVLSEYDGSGNQTKYYTWGPNGLLAITFDGKTYYTVHNAHGDIEALTDANGNVVVTYTYDTWGNLVSNTDNSGTGLAAANPYRYANYRFDDGSGMYYLMARWYDPSIGRFLSQDPASVQPDYVYGINNPVSYYDPSGQDEALTLDGFFTGLESIGEAVISGLSSGAAAAAGGVVAGGMYLGTPTVLGNSDMIGFGHFNATGFSTVIVS